MTHQQCKDSISVLNPLESPAAFLCLKHNVKLRPMHGLKKANLFTKIWEGVKLASSTHDSRFKTCLIHLDYSGEEAFASFKSSKIQLKKHDFICRMDILYTNINTDSNN